MTQVDPAIARALTPSQAISPRSTVPMLEGVLTPVFLTHAFLAREGMPLRLEGTLEHLNLIPVTEKNR